MKKILFLFVAVTMLFACATNSLAAGVYDFVPDADTLPDDDLLNLISGLQQIYQSRHLGPATLENDYVILSITDVGIPIPDYIGVSVEIHNKTDQELYIQNGETTLNGWSIGEIYPFHSDLVAVGAGAKLRDIFYFSDGVKKAGISSADEIDTLIMSFYINDNKYHPLTITDSITFTK